MHVTEAFLREAILEVRSVMGFNTGAYSDSEIMGMKGDVISALVQAKTALSIHVDQMARSAQS